MDRQQRSLKTRRRPLLAGAAALGLSACGGGGATDGAAAPLTAATLGPQTVRAAADYLGDAEFAGASVELGNRLLLQCRACHSLDADGPHMLGPNLHGVFGRKAGTAPGYNYTRSFQTVEFIWTPRALDAWLAQPATFLPGNAMAYGGIPHADDRAALIASLLRATSREP